MIHGMGGGGWCWGNFKNFFEEKGYCCITPTLRFHDMNSSQSPDERLGTASLLDYAKDIEQEINNLNVTPILMGYSMGGLLAQILASKKLAKVLILLASAPPYGIKCFNFSTIRSFWNIIKKWGFWKKPFRQGFSEISYAALHLVPLEEQRELYEKLVYESGQVIFEIGLGLFDSRKAAKVDESEVNCPVLVIAGVEDRIISPSIVKKIVVKYNKVSAYKEFANHAHWLLGEPGWQEIAEYINKWLESNIKNEVG